MRYFCRVRVVWWYKLCVSACVPTTYLSPRFFCCLLNKAMDPDYFKSHVSVARPLPVLLHYDSIFPDSAICRLLPSDYLHTFRPYLPVCMTWCEQVSWSVERFWPKVLHELKSVWLRLMCCLRLPVDVNLQHSLPSTPQTIRPLVTTGVRNFWHSLNSLMMGAS